MTGTPGLSDEMRALIREAHGAEKDLRRAIKDGKDERDALENRIEQYLSNEVDRLLAETEKRLERVHTALQSEIERTSTVIIEAGIAISDATSELAGIGSQEAAQAIILDALIGACKVMMPDIIGSAVTAQIGKSGKKIARVHNEADLRRILGLNGLNSDKI